MALIECPECGKQISDKALRCPQCGAPKVSTASPIPRVPGLLEKPRKRARMRIFFLLLLVMIIGVSYWFWRASTSDRVAPPSAGIFAVFRSPKTVVDERVELKQGEFISYRFGLRSDSRVEVQVNAQPQHVDVMIMTQEEADKLRPTSGRLSGGESAYVQALSSKQVHNMDKTEVLPKGEWTVFVFRPSEAPSFQEKTSVNIIVTAY
jgi:zinc-ribbon domain